MGVARRILRYEGCSVEVLVATGGGVTAAIHKTRASQKANQKPNQEPNQKPIQKRGEPTCANDTWGTHFASLSASLHERDHLPGGTGCTDKASVPRLPGVGATRWRSWLGAWGAGLPGNLLGAGCLLRRTFLASRGGRWSRRTSRSSGGWWSGSRWRSPL
jgi:hypothetical protein